jgi:hypothetical protein
MKSWFADNYEKIILLSAVSFIILQIFITSGHKFIKITSSNQYSQFKIIELRDETFIEPSKSTSVLPGSSMYYKNLDSSEWSEEKIKNIHLIKRQKILLLTTDNREIEGTLVGDFSLNENWQTSAESLAIRQQRDTIFVPVKKIDKITTLQRIKIAENLKDLDWNNQEISLFQRLNLKSSNVEPLPGKPKWTGSNPDSNSTKYDLFTPPIIYLDDGKLTARLPEKEKPQELKEPFGLKLLSAKKAPYFLKLASWVGTVPYFEDRKAKLSESSTKFTRNRLEVGKFYKRDLNRKSGQPSLIECDESDPNRLLQVEHFIVQQLKNAKTGGLRLVGRSLIRDYVLGGEPFEINSIMEDVFAGDYTFVLAFNLPGQDEQILELSSKEEGRIFSFAGRSYQVVEIDLKSNHLTIVKKDPRVLEDVEKRFQFTGL